MSSDPLPRIKLPRGLAPLGYPNFFFFWVGFAASHTGRWIELTGSVWLVYELSHSPVLLGLLGIARAAPAFIFSPIAGVIADRVDQRQLLFIAQGLALAVSLSIGLLVAADRISLWQIYVAVTVQAAITAFDSAARQALFPRLVPRSRLTEAVTLTITASRFAKLIGPISGGLAIGSLGVSSPFLLNAASFLVLMGAVALMRGVMHVKEKERPSFKSELSEGLRHILDAPVISGLFKMEIVFGIFEMNPVLITIVGREVLGVGPEALGGLLSAPALGSFAGIAWLLTIGPARRQGRFCILCTMAYSVALLLFAATANYAICFVALALVGTFDAFVVVTRNSILQLAAPGRMRGRIMSNMGLITRGVGPLAETQSGFLAAALGPSLAVVGAAATLAIAAGITARRNLPLWNFSHDDSPHLSAAPE